MPSQRNIKGRQTCREERRAPLPQAGLAGGRASRLHRARFSATRRSGIGLSQHRAVGLDPLARSLVAQNEWRALADGTGV